MLFGLNAVDELDRTAFNVLSPEIRDHFGLDLAGVLGLISGVEALAILFGLPLAYWADRRSRVRMATAGATLWGGCSLLSGLAPSVGFLAAARAGAGMGRAVTTPTHFSLLADYYPPEVRPKVYGTHRAANSVGQFIGPILAGVLALWLGWRAPFILFALPTFVFVLLALRLREPVRGAHERRAVGASEETATTEEPPPGFLEGFRVLWGVRTLRRVWCALPFAAAVMVGLGALFAVFYQEEFGLNSAQRGLASAATEPAQILGLLVGVPVANRLLKRDPALVLRFIAVVGVVIAASFAALSVTPYLAVVIVMHMVISAAAALLTPGTFSVLSLAIPPRVRSLGFAASALWILPGLAVYPMIGALADTWGIRPAILMLCPVLLVAGFLLASAGRFVNDDITRARTAAAAEAAAVRRRTEDEPVRLVVRDLDVAYDGVVVLRGVDFEVGGGEVVAVAGPAGAGKTTLLRTVSGLVVPSRGTVRLNGHDLVGAAPPVIAGLGVVRVPGGAGFGPSATVADQLRAAAADAGHRDPGLAEVAAGHFPPLLGKLDHPAGTLPGPEQEMLALARAFVAPPRLLLIDQVSFTLVPPVLAGLVAVIRTVREHGGGVVLVDHPTGMALAVADVACLLEGGEFRFCGPAAELAKRPDLLRAVFSDRPGDGSAVPLEGPAPPSPAP